VSTQSEDWNVLIQEFLQTRRQIHELEEQEMELLHALKEFSGPPDLNLMIFYVGHGGKFATWIPGIPFFVNNESFPALSTDNDDELKDILSHLEGIIHPEDFPPLARNIRELWNGRTPTLYGRHRLSWAGMTTIWAESHIMVIKRDQQGIPIEFVACVRFPGRPPRGSIINQLSINLSEFFGSINEQDSPLATLFELGDENKTDFAKEARDLAGLVMGVGMAEGMGATKSWNLSFVKNRSMRYVWVSAQFAKTLGRSRREVQGRLDSEFFDTVDEVEEERQGEAVSRGATVHFRCIRIIDGTRRVFQETLWPVPQGSGGEAQWILGVSRLLEAEEIAVDVQRSSVFKIEGELLEAARSASIVLITGESGCGKDHLARYIHDNLEPSSGPFFSINCAAISPELAESELFGHEAGAFTGARTRKRGLLELAEGGTLLLNEIGELSLPLQAKLLTFLDTRKITRVGGEKEISVNARLIAATNKDLEEEVQQGRFRKDLFYRINVLNIDVPPLRKRQEDLPQIAAKILEELSKELGMPEPLQITRAHMKAMKQYPWPGNIRELRNVLERAMLLGKSISDVLPGTVPQEDDRKPVESVTGNAPYGRGGVAEEWSWTTEFCAGRNYRELLAELERALFEEAIKRSGGNKALAARLLGTARETVFRKLDKMGIDRDK